MEKRNKISLTLIIVLTICVIGLCVYSVITNKNNKITDSEKFRNEYMELNDNVNENTGKAYVNVSISETNTVKYISEKDVVNMLKNGTGVIYFGFNTCPWCRSLITPLTKIAEDKNETIYYLDILNIRSSFSLEEGELSRIKDGSKGYYNILELLDNKLEEFYLTDEAGNKYDTGEKRLYAPTLVAVNEGEITGFHVGTVKSQESGYDTLNKKELNELESIITKLINSKNNKVCTKNKC